MLQLDAVLLFKISFICSVVIVYVAGNSNAYDNGNEIANNDNQVSPLNRLLNDNSNNEIMELQDLQASASARRKLKWSNQDDHEYEPALGDSGMAESYHKYNKYGHYAVRRRLSAKKGDSSSSKKTASPSSAPTSKPTNKPTYRKTPKPTRRNSYGKPTPKPTPKPTTPPTCQTYAERLSNVGRSEFYRYWSSSKKDHHYTTNYNELGSGRSSYKLEGNAGYLWDSEINGVTVELYRYYAKCKGQNHFYTSNYNELGDGTSKYKKETSPGYIMKVDCSDYNNFNRPLYRYYSSSICDHFYTTNYNELKDGSGTSYRYEGIAGYVATSLGDTYTIKSDDDLHKTMESNNNDGDLNGVILDMVDSSNKKDESYSWSNDMYTIAMLSFIGGILFSCLLFVIYKQFCDNNRIKSIVFNTNNNGYQTL